MTTTEQALLALVLLAALVATMTLRRRWADVWSRFARRHRLAARPDGAGHGAPALTGTVEGRRLRLRSADESSDLDLLGATEVEMSIELRQPPPAGLTLRHRTALDGAGGDTVATGDAEFDHAVRVSAPDSRAALAWLGPRRRQALDSLLRQSGSGAAGLTNGRLWLRERRAVASLPHLEARLRALLAVAEELDHESS